MDTKKALKKGATLGAGIFLKKALSYPFDYILYPLMLIWLGHIWGGLVMTVLSIPFNLFIIRVYDWSKIDWLLIETAKAVRYEEAKSGWRGFVGRTLRKSDVLAFFVLCFDDPTVVTLYLRHGSNQYDGMSRRDWKIFLAATVVANLYWIVGWVAIIELWRWVVGTFTF